MWVLGQFSEFRHSACYPGKADSCRSGGLGVYGTVSDIQSFSGDTFSFSMASNKPSGSGLARLTSSIPIMMSNHPWGRCIFMNSSIRKRFLVDMIPIRAPCRLSLCKVGRVSVKGGYSGSCADFLLRNTPLSRRSVAPYL